MFLLEWYREWLEIRYDSRKRKNEVVVEEKVCQSCETLRQQLDIANYEKRELLSKILKEPEKVPERIEAPEMKSIPRVVPWKVRQQMLEREDREKAKLMRNAPKPAETVSTEDLEKELKVAEREREKQEQSS